MFDNLNLRNKFLAVAAVPVNILVILALWSAAIADQAALAVVALAGGVVTLTVALAGANSLARRVTAMTDDANELATVRLPNLLAELHRPSRSGAPTESVMSAPDAGEESPVTPRPVFDDELAQLAAALSSIEARAEALVDTERAGISKNLGGMVKNLARRNQSLLDRQIDHIDWLEAKEQDPDRLEQLFKLDHLATRMRRSSESVLVLGGAESTRHRGGPASIADVLRVAMGETEDYRNIRLRTVDEVMVAGGPAFDVAHLLAEVLENATQFSPPESPVELHATGMDDGTFQVTVIDRGVGMDQRQLEAANALVANPPEIGLSVGHSVGFIVIGRLAKRIGANVELSATAGSGVTVQVRLPASIIVGGAAAGPPSDTSTEQTPSPGSTGPLSRLLGLENAVLPEGEGWTPPTVDAGRAKPLRSRDGATAAVPAGLRPAGADQAPTEIAAAEPAPDESRSAAAQAGTTDRPAAEAEPQDPGSADKANDGPSHQAKPARSNRGRAAAGQPNRAQPTRKAKTLAEALPTGAAFDSGVDGLLASPSPESPSPAGEPAPGSAAGDDTWTPPIVEPAAGTEGPGLTRRQRGASSIPSDNGPRARASTRKPEEIRSMINRYRGGLKGAAAEPADAAESAEPPETSSPPTRADMQTVRNVVRSLLPFSRRAKRIHLRLC